MMLQGLGDIRLSLFVLLTTFNIEVEEVELFAVSSNSAPSDQTVVTVVTVVFRRSSGAPRRVLSVKC